LPCIELERRDQLWHQGFGLTDVGFSVSRMGVLLDHVAISPSRILSTCWIALRSSQSEDGNSRYVPDRLPQLALRRNLSPACTARVLPTPLTGDGLHHLHWYPNYLQALFALATRSSTASSGPKPFCQHIGLSQGQTPGLVVVRGQQIKSGRRLRFLPP